jgi:hypothetical protein
MQDGQVRARVFISCGQSDVGDERQIADQIRLRLEQDGFDPYVAVKEQSMRGVRENIFEQLRKSEYFVFIDFKREALTVANPARHRGSLFCHQELAIASFLEIELLALQEESVAREGLLGYIQANATPFTDRNSLHHVVADKIKTRGWTSGWRNELELEGREPVDNVGTPHGVAKFFHVNVKNKHRNKWAINCCAYLESAIQRSTGTSIPLETIEFKWAGTQLASVGIAPGKARKFDACLILQKEPIGILFNVRTDSTEYVPRFPNEAGEYQLTFVVTSENFPPVRATFLLRLAKSYGETTLTLAD